MDRDWFVYMLECAGGRIYTGVAVDVAARFEQHRRGKGAAYTRANPPRRLLAAMPCASRGHALSVEHGLKQLDRTDKLEWAAAWPPSTQGEPT